MLKKILIGFVVLVALIVVVGFLLPTEYKIERSVEIDASAPEVHTFVGELRNWPRWAPWIEDDPNIVTTYGEITNGAGASQTWTSKDGDGELALSRSDPRSGIAYEMVFIMDGKRAPAQCEMNYSERAGKTTVTWTMEGDASDFMPSLVGGYMTILLKSQIGSMFDRGLQNLKKTVE